MSAVPAVVTPPEPAADEAFVGAEPLTAVARFEALVARRGSRPERSTLSARLAKAGVDPHGTLADDDVLLHEVARLQELASEAPAHRHWWRRGR